ncbi:Excinuclease ATPase subunit [gamma proteobacterium HdN1]|nr:Excinuclease ATPase subunit [gamma proteobacterium HdN1]
MDKIIVRGARTHNLKNINLVIPRDKFVVITGLSGSGKSSLAFDTLYAEGQRRYVESLSTYARQFLSIMEKPDVDHIEGLSPAISIEQKSTSHNPRSTVGTVTEIHDYLRLLFARVGTPYCPEHHQPLEAQTVSQMVDEVMALSEKQRFMLLAPVIKEKKGGHQQLFENLKAQGFIRARIDGAVIELDEAPSLSKNKKHTIEVIVDRFKVKDGLQTRLAESFETALKLSGGIAIIATMDGTGAERLFSSSFSCPHCNYSLGELEPRLFSFNSPSGACPTCDGLGISQYISEKSVITAPSSSLENGAIRGWDKKNFFYHQMLISLSRHYQFNISTPFNQLSAKIQSTILHGSGTESIQFRYSNERGDLVTRHHAFEGIIPNIERRYKETESESVREELSHYMSTTDCPDCNGSRLNLSARNVYVNSYNLPTIVNFAVTDALEHFSSQHFTGQKKAIADKILKEVIERLQFLANVGLGYLTLNRRAETLSGGEAQRIRLASQIGAGLVGVLYILDEPSIGLHQRDNDRLLKSLLRLRDLGNTVIVVEHDEDAIRSADHIIDMGAGAGVHGGNVVAEGKIEDILNQPLSLTGRYLSGEEKIEIPTQSLAPNPERMIVLTGANGNNLKDVTLRIPVGLLTCITGVSGSGKSTLINGTLYPIAAQTLNGATTTHAEPYEAISGLEHFDSVIDISQQPIGRTPRSNPATYTGLFAPIRDLFASTPEARSRGYTAGRFSFNVKGGRCEACQGDGLIKVEMHFLPDMYVHCDVCKGQRYNRETLEISYKGKTIHDVLEMTVEVAHEFFSNIPTVTRKLKTLVDVGLSYVRLGQSATTLSGGEAQRIKLSKELSRRSTGRSLYILDEPTTGLHFHDIKQLLAVLQRLRESGNTIVIIEHNLDVIKTADWIVDLGPEGGKGGGQIIAEASPADLIQIKTNSTGIYLARHIDQHNAGIRNPKKEKKPSRKRSAQ